jgi:aryl-alcohol dehydrogenase-like predicted oxidoreductase
LSVISQLQLPPVVLGCGNFGGIGSAPAFFGQGETEEQAFAIMDAAWALGIRWLDTADAYGGGRSETFIGRWMRATGNRPRITSKVFHPMSEGGDRGLGRSRVLRQLESSLERLGIDRLDLYLAHDFDPETPLEEVATTFQGLVELGLIGVWGVSNFSAEQLVRLLEHGRPACVQNSFSLLDRRDEQDVIPLCREQGIAYQAYSPLCGGWLTGKYRRGQPPPPGSRMTLRPEPYLHLDHDGVYDLLEQLDRRAAARGASMAGLALAWVLSRPGVSSAVVGPRRPEHLQAVVEARALAEVGREPVLP